jgi:hypothetical protein
MIRSVCSVCGIQYGSRSDGLSEVIYSHGYCELHYDEAMANIKSQFDELDADLRGIHGQV